MRVYDITTKALESDYHGCGKAWAAVVDGEVVAIRYMDTFAFSWPDQPEWIKAVREHATGLDYHMLPTCYGSKALSAIGKACSECSDCPKPPRKERYRPSELLTMARAALSAVQAAQFGEYRKQCRSELAQLGEAISGVCSCTKFTV